MAGRKVERSRAVFAAAQHYLPGGVNSPVRSFKAVGGDPVVVAEASGTRLTDVDGNSYIDYCGSWGPLILGHADPAVVAAVSAAAARGTTYGAATEAEVALARLVCESVPSIEMVRFVSSGTEATMSALRLARAYTGRSKIVKFEGGYHGHADGLLVQAGSGVATLALPDSAGVPAAYAAETLLCPYNDMAAIAALFEQRGAEIAAVIVEPVAANMGVVPPAAGFLERLRELSSAAGALLIFDEVITGFRVGLGGYQALAGVTPDLTCLGKVIGGGLPVGAYGGRREVMALVAPLGPVYQAGTLSGNPLAMAAGLATLAAIRAAGLFRGAGGQSGAPRGRAQRGGGAAGAIAAAEPGRLANDGLLHGRAGDGLRQRPPGGRRPLRALLPRLTGRGRLLPALPVRGGVRLRRPHGGGDRRDAGGGQWRFRGRRALAGRLFGQLQVCLDLGGDRQPLLDRRALVLGREKNAGLVAGIGRHDVDVVVGDCLAGGDAVIREDVQPGGVKCLADRPREASYLRREARHLGRAEVQDGGSVPPGDDQQVAAAEHALVDEGVGLAVVDDDGETYAGDVTAEGAALVGRQLEGQATSPGSLDRLSVKVRLSLPISKAILPPVHE